jgi:hypothetical protein
LKLAKGWTARVWFLAVSLGVFLLLLHFKWLRHPPSLLSCGYWHLFLCDKGSLNRKNIRSRMHKSSPPWFLYTFISSAFKFTVIHLNLKEACGCSVSIATRLQAGWLGFNSWQGKGHFP